MGGHLPLLLDETNLKEGEQVLMNGEVDLIPCKLDKMPEGKLIHDINEAKVCDVGTETSSTDCARYYKGLSAHKDNMCIVNNKKVYRIRKLTPKECWRLMGYTDEDFTNAEKVNSNTQLYKEAGNAIVKQVLMAIFSQMGIKGVPKWNETKEVIE